jgi:hypothetical protein
LGKTLATNNKKTRTPRRFQYPPYFSSLEPNSFVYFVPKVVTLGLPALLCLLAAYVALGVMVESEQDLDMNEQERREYEEDIFLELRVESFLQRMEDAKHLDYLAFAFGINTICASTWGNFAIVFAEIL